MSNVRRLLTTDRVFFVTVNVRRNVQPLGAVEYPLMIEAVEASRRRLGFALCGYVLMPDHWHALIWPRHPLTISQALHDVKKTSLGGSIGNAAPKARCGSTSSGTGLCVTRGNSTSGWSTCI